MNGKEDTPPTKDQIISTAIEHLNLACAFKGERVGVREMQTNIMVSKRYEKFK